MIWKCARIAENGSGMVTLLTSVIVKTDRSSAAQDKSDHVVKTAHLRSGHGPVRARYTRRTPPPGTGALAS